MDKLSRAIFAFLFFITFVGNMIDSKESADVAPLIEARSHARSTSFVITKADSTIIDPGIHADQTSSIEQSIDADKKYFPCESLSISTAGAVCDGNALDFPEVNLKDVLDGDSYLPHKSTNVFVSERLIRAVVYRNISLELRWDPATPSFLQMHLAEYLPYWENRIPYRLFWNAHYEICYEFCSEFYGKGEFLPEDIEGLPSSLAADINFNGVPAAFWNENINP